MAKWSTLLLAGLLDSPALYHAFVLHDLDYTSALVRYLIAVVVAAVMLALLRGLANGYKSRNDAEVRAAARAAAQEAAMEALDAARANPAVMAHARRSTDTQPEPDEPAA
ncbi:hypothetical protein ACNTMW_21840 [Planosporangium sp. 12N6]|uniref:hypothetical protein n=1 Tax=Planosporangium spinosum TaxID=3402278 RepID=UPI003CE9BB50